MNIDPHRTHRLASVVCVCVLVVGLGLAPASSAGAEAADPAALEATAEEFLAAFAEKNLDRVDDLLAEGALIQRARLESDGPELVTFTAAEWLAESGPAIAGIEEFRIEPLSTTVLDFGAGATVSVRFRATGRVGGGHFVNEGVDTFSFAQVDGAWKIVLYQSLEQLVFHQATDSPEDGS